MSKRIGYWFGGAGAALVLMAGTSLHAATIAHWDFNNNLTDTTASPLNLTQPPTTNTGGFSSDVPAGFGGASWNLASTPSYVYATPGVNTKLELQTFTVDAWVKGNTAGWSQVIFTYEPMGAGGFGRGILFFVSGGVLVLDKGDGTGFQALAGTTTMAGSTWYHVTGSYNATTRRMNLYINGVLDATTVFSAAHGTVDYSDAGGTGPNPKTLYVGAVHSDSPSGPATSNFTSGISIGSTTFSKIDELSVLDVAVPEPVSLGLLAAGLLLAFSRRRGM